MDYVKAYKTDIEQLVTMRLLYLEEDFENISEEQRQQIAEELPKYFNKHLGRDIIVFVAKLNNMIVATAFLLIIEKPANPRFVKGLTGEVLNVYTHVGYRRQGIAKHLMEMIIEYSMDEQLDFIELKSTSDGYKLYTDLGFVETHSSYKTMKLIIDKKNQQ